MVRSFDVLDDTAVGASATTLPGGITGPFASPWTGHDPLCRRSGDIGRRGAFRYSAYVYARAGRRGGVICSRRGWNRDAICIIGTGGGWDRHRVRARRIWRWDVAAGHTGRGSVMPSPPDH